MAESQTRTPTAHAGNESAAATVALLAVAIALGIIALSGGNGGGIFSSKDGKTDPYTGRTTGPVLMDF